MAWTAAPAFGLKLDKAVLDSVQKQPTPQDVLAAIPAPKADETVTNTKFGLTQSQLIELGRFIFNNVTFQGNGRTCATCHPATNNFTIDPEFIATLPPNDPLFVAETNPALADLRTRS